MRNFASIFLSAAILSTPALAVTVMTDVSVKADRDAGTAQFDILFSGRPDFFTVDEYGRQKDEFQFEIDGPREGRTYPLVSLIRGGEIHLGDGLRIRSPGPSDPSPVSGGWGAVRGSVAYMLSGSHLSFEVPFETLGVPGGAFRYLAFETNYGGTVGDTFRGSIGNVPLPYPGVLLVAGIAALGAIGFRRRGQAAG